MALRGGKGGGGPAGPAGRVFCHDNSPLSPCVCVFYLLWCSRGSMGVCWVGGLARVIVHARLFARAPPSLALHGCLGLVTGCDKAQNECPLDIHTTCHGETVFAVWTRDAHAPMSVFGVQSQLTKQNSRNSVQSEESAPAKFLRSLSPLSSRWAQRRLLSVAMRASP